MTIRLARVVHRPFRMLGFSFGHFFLSQDLFNFLCVCAPPLCVYMDHVHACCRAEECERVWATILCRSRACSQQLSHPYSPLHVPYTWGSCGSFLLCLLQKPFPLHHLVHTILSFTQDNLSLCWPSDLLPDTWHSLLTFSFLIWYINHIVTPVSAPIILNDLPRCLFHLSNDILHAWNGLFLKINKNIKLKLFKTHFCQGWMNKKNPPPWFWFVCKHLCHFLYFKAYNQCIYL